MLDIIRTPKMFLCIPVAALVMGCSSTATLTRVGAPEVDGKVVTSDSQTIYVETDGRTSPIARQSVTDIDHPGNVAAIVGGMVTAYGAANIVIGAPDCNRGEVAYCTGVFLPAALGAPMLLWGVATWARSKIVTGGGKIGGPNVAVVPTASFDKKNEFFGVSATVRY